MTHSPDSIPTSKQYRAIMSLIVEFNTQQQVYRGNFLGILQDLCQVPFGLVVLHLLLSSFSALLSWGRIIFLLKVLQGNNLKLCVPKDIFTFPKVWLIARLGMEFWDGSNFCLEFCYLFHFVWHTVSFSPAWPQPAIGKDNLELLVFLPLPPGC